MIPRTYVHKFYKQVSDELGSKIIYLENLHQRVVVISDVNIARDLLDKRSSTYSNRPQRPMINDVIGFRSLLALMPYGATWRLQRRLFQQHLSEKHLPKLEERVLEFIRKGLLASLLESPDNVREHLRNAIGGLSLSMTYGSPVQRHKDPLVQLAEEGFSNLAGAGSPGKYLVNIIPHLRYLPEWFPGTEFKQEGKRIRAQLDGLMELPYRETDAGTASPCFVTEALQRIREHPDSSALEEHVKQIAVQVFQAAGESTFVPIMTFILAMVLHPEVQLKAQKEVDSVVGAGRLPSFSDIPNLKYISAIVKEVFRFIVVLFPPNYKALIYSNRWNPVVPLGGPRVASEEDVYKGYYIPKGAVIIPNFYAMLHDEKTFPQPDEFKPERFLSQDGESLRRDILDPEFIVTFGFGRRICPGAHIARATIYVALASILYLFDISPAINSEGRPISVKPQFAPASATSPPLPFPCKVTPRAGKDVECLLQGYLGTDPM
ncbi:hypothetical protein NP233_g11723 [Leucocoprinus birnbaumii]|uniref:Cytochrome P450 n=1 Tax=Leucocoprinus birnbaumii TaxID=56174 RepID=A0AAD5VFV9_9AGAR|nr:hypothetical protein NP233_g11723 [Leucocoprinus birnbaumii]